MRALYARRQQSLITALEREPIPEIRIDAAPAGLHLLGRLPREADDRQISLELAKARIDARPLSEFAIRRKLPPTLILGYAGINERAIRDGVRRMRRVLRDSST
jgi:GntR family transcriptional regulator / MocR family aminotransferase